MSWVHTAVVSTTYIGPLEDLEINGCYGDKRVAGEGTSSDLSGEDKKVFVSGLKHSDEARVKRTSLAFQFTRTTINENDLQLIEQPKTKRRPRSARGPPSAETKAK